MLAIRLRRTDHFVIGVNLSSGTFSHFSPFLALPAPPNLHPPTPPPFLHLPPLWWPQPPLLASWVPLTLYGEGVRQNKPSTSCTMWVWRGIFPSVHGSAGRSNRGAKRSPLMLVVQSKRYLRFINGYRLDHLWKICGTNKFNTNHQGFIHRSAVLTARRRLWNPDSSLPGRGVYLSNVLRLNAYALWHRLMPGRSIIQSTQSTPHLPANLDGLRCKIKMDLQSTDETGRRFPGTHY